MQTTLFHRLVLASLLVLPALGSFYPGSIRSAIASIRQPQSNPPSQSDFEGFHALTIALKQSACTPAKPCTVNSPFDDSDLTRLSSSLATLLDSFGELATQHAVTRRIRLEANLVFSVAQVLAARNLNFANIQLHKKNPSHLDQVFTRLFEMAGCIDNMRSLNMCRSTTIPHPFILASTPQYMLIARLIEMFPWVGEFVVIRDDAFVWYQQLMRDQQIVTEFPRFAVWLRLQHKFRKPSGPSKWLTAGQPNA